MCVCFHSSAAVGDYHEAAIRVHVEEGNTVSTVGQLEERRGDEWGGSRGRHDRKYKSKRQETEEREKSEQ